jgi:ubiquinone/menaquinone biosynthesis C-methylase UbiE
MSREGSFDKVADEYDASRGGRERAVGFARQLAERLALDDLVLDVGVGTGIVALELVELGYRVVGVDISPAMLGRARDRLGARVAVADAAALPFRTGSVPQAVSTWLLHVVPNQMDVFMELARVLRPGGHWLVLPGRVPRPDDTIGWLIREIDDAAGRNRDDSAAMAACAEAAGFTLMGEFAHREKRFVESPAEVAARLETGLYSTTWSTQREAEVAAVRRRAVQTLRGMPNPDTRRERIVVDHVIHYRC